ncbi:uncharacterized protein [Engystomops pustulosus]|uniref:uncharacterized protein n=1 Tax=Engystomops pustulosus TaxID=76066 RepID=UPI003AFB0944
MHQGNASDSPPKKVHSLMSPVEPSGSSNGRETLGQNQIYVAYLLLASSYLVQNWTRFWRKLRIGKKAFQNPDRRDTPFVIPVTKLRPTAEKVNKADGATQKEVEVEVTVPSRVPNPTLPEDNDARVGGRLALFPAQWQQYIRNTWFLQVIREGYKIELSTPPPHTFVTTRTSSQQMLLMWEEVQSLLLKDVISPVPPHQQKKGFYSLLFLVQKPNGAYRMIINLKSKYPYQIQEIQDGFPKVHNTTNPKRSSSMHHRPERRVLPRPNPSLLSKIPEIRDLVPRKPGKALSVQSSTIRDLLGS